MPVAICIFQKALGFMPSVMAPWFAGRIPLLPDLRLGSRSRRFLARYGEIRQNDVKQGDQAPSGTANRQGWTLDRYSQSQAIVAL